MDQAVAQQAERAQTFARLAGDLNRQPDLDSIYVTACQGIARALAVDTSFIALFDESSQSYRTVKAYRDGAWLPIQQYPVFSARAPEPAVLKVGAPTIIYDYQVQERLKDQDGPTLTLPAVILLTPLYHKGTHIGVLGAGDHDRERIFLPEETGFVQAFADQVAPAIVHTHLFETTKKQALFRQLAAEITHIALDDVDVKGMLDLLANRFVETLPIEGCYISLWDQRRNVLSPHAAAGPNKEIFLSKSASPEDDSFLEAVFGTGQALFIPDSQLPAEPAEKAGSASQARLVLPMKTGARKIGVIQITVQNLHGDFSDEERRRWEEIAAQITLAITSILSIEQEKKHRQEAELLQQATITIASSLNLQEVLNQILTSLKKVVPFDSAAICLIEDEYLRIAAQGGSAWHFREVGDRIEKSAGLFPLLETAHSPVYLADAQQHPNYQQWSADGKTLIHGWMGVPLIAYDRTIGYLLLNNQEIDVYTPDHARLAQAFVNQAALAIEKARLFEQVRNGRERLRAVSKKLVEIQEEERRFIAHELHDEIGQELTGLQFLLEMCKNEDEETKLQALAESQELVRGLMAQVRELSINLHPSMIDDLGLLPALNAHFVRFQQKTGIRVQFSYQNLERRFAPGLEVAAFRVVQEALTNTARYAGVKELDVNIVADNATLTIEITDHGQGFDTRILQDSNRSFGIAGMRERTELAGGKFELFSSPRRGTRIIAVFPNGDRVERRKGDRKSPAG